MSWKEELEQLEHAKDWKAAIDLIGEVINKHPDDVEAYVRGIYLLLNILLEEDYPYEHDVMANLLKKYFDESYSKFSEVPEYLFFVGYFMVLADWYFGQHGYVLADQMKKKASDLEPDNMLYEWSWRFGNNDPLAKRCAEQLLRHDTEKIEWLKSKGAPGTYMLDVIKRWVCRNTG